MNLTEMSLFPLNTVLFPGGILPLRIFEPRYLSMVGDCMRHGRDFGVVLALEAQEDDQTAQFYAVGTAARIVDFDQLDDGMLGITCRGGQLLRVQSHRLQPDRLIVGEVELLVPDEPEPVPSEYGPMAEFLRHILAREEAQSYRRQLEEDWASADWLGCRLAELLPLTLASKQTLLEMDSLQRLQVLHAVMEENELLS